ncbi:MAG: GGDEF domain-containing protein [Clostridia bacterium]|nr:GGDEF domain-containing protein [Clostridia bacterium]
MSDYLQYYTESNVVCIIIFGIILIHDLLNVNRREKQIKYDRALVTFIVYFSIDIVWAMILDGFLPKTVYTVALANLANFICMAAITHSWLEYAKASLLIPDRNKASKKFLFSIPFVASLVAMVVLFLIKQDIMIGSDTNPTIVYYLMLIIVPSINIVASLLYAVKKVKNDVNSVDRKKHLGVGVFPLLVLLGGMVQVLILPKLCIFCFASTILMVSFHVQLMQTEISVDSLTGLNNRGALTRFIAQSNDGHVDDSRTYVIMMDINSFKLINDTFGHAEGDRALTIIAKALKSVAKAKNTIMFLGRYGGDEFIMIVKSESTDSLEKLIEELRSRISNECVDSKTPYIISIGAGYDEILNESDSFKNCIQRADQKMYVDKDIRKSSGSTTVILTGSSDI